MTKVSVKTPTLGVLRNSFVGIELDFCVLGLQKGKADYLTLDAFLTPKSVISLTIKFSYVRRGNLSVFFISATSMK